MEPEYRDGRTVRFTDDPADGVPPTAEPWDGSRVLYLLHASDPIVLWSPQLLYARPDWLEEARGDDVVDAMRWIPFVTFWQVTADLPFAGNVPDGHGHVYTTQYVDAWAQVLQPPGWTDERPTACATSSPAGTDPRLRTAGPPRRRPACPASWSPGGAGPGRAGCRCAAGAR